MTQEEKDYILERYSEVAADVEGLSVKLQYLGQYWEDWQSLSLCGDLRNSLLEILSEVEAEEVEKE